MARVRIEVCMISARGLRRSSPPWKPQWFAVGWVDANNKYCTRVDSSGSSSPTWNTKFSSIIDDGGKDSVLTVEVYSRDPFFLREKLRGTATVNLTEFLRRAGNGPAGPEVMSYQLRKKKSSRARGFVDVSVRVSDGSRDGSRDWDSGSGISLVVDDGPSFPHRNEPPIYPTAQNGIPSGNYPNQLPTGMEQRRRPGTPPPPSPPANAGFIPSFFPGISRLPESYVSQPNSGSTVAHGGGSAFGAGVGAGALAAGAVIFGDDFLWAQDIPLAFGRR
ncbi:unnamed protein product [Spirodela intermedia]|uniref:C2 domain-containing protein n=2 Tax=Spirodela intermedia TaxID=51605 RepID=A0A7I8L7Z2_SPIIN|nr:unnamed protein product [Spirodela intermedia]CAA6669220.1 unnamed protein product [Spirodela intermedia]CAA7406167.1 unnamed protein product [Spirodela intermedia]